MYRDYDYEYYDGEDSTEILTDIKIIYQTDKAILILHKNKKAWFPKSVIINLDEEAIEYEYDFSPTWQTTIKRMKPIEGNFI